MPLSLNLGAVGQAASDAAMAAADAAMTAAANARQMVLNRDPSLAALEATASTASAAVQTGIDDRAALHAQLDALALLVNALPTIRTGTAQVTASLLPGISRDVVVTLAAPMPSATYSAGAWINGGTSLLGQTQLVGITGQTATTVTVQIKNAGLTSIAASALTVQVLAVK